MIFVNGLGFEGWMDRLVKASGTKATVVVATKASRRASAARTSRRTTTITAPRARRRTPATTTAPSTRTLAIGGQCKGLCGERPRRPDRRRPAGKDTYTANAAAYLAKLDQLESEVKAAMASIPEANRRIITSHDAFGYFGDAYGLKLLAPEGVSTESEASAKDVGKIIRQIKEQHIPAVFLENVTNPRLIERLGKESGAIVGGTLYSDALSRDNGPASTYIDLVRYNIRQLSGALTK